MVRCRCFTDSAALVVLAEQALRLRHPATAGQRHHVKVVQNE